MTETTGQPPQTPPPPPAPADGFDRLRALGVARPAEGRWIGGVAAGLARRWNLDPLLVRGVFVALTIVSGIGLLLYGLAWMLLPEDDGTIHVQRVTKGDVSAGMVGAGIFVLLFLVTGGPDSGPGPVWWGLPGIVVGGLIALGVWFWATRSNRTNPPGGPAGPGRPGTPWPAATPGSPGWQQATTYGAPGPYGAPAPYPAAPRPQGAPYTGGPAYGTPPPVPPRATLPPPPKPPRRDPASLASHRITRVTLGVAVLAAVAVVLVERTAGWPGDADTTVITMATALAVMAAGIITAGALGRRSGGLAPLAILLALALGIASAAAAADLRTGNDRISVVGERDWRPTTAGQADLDYNLVVGDGTLWLTDPRILSTRQGTSPIQAMAQVGAGTLTVVLPEGTPAEVHSEIGGGLLVRPDGSRQRFDADGDDHTAEVIRVGPAGPASIVVQARVGFGEIVIRSATPTGVLVPQATPSAAPSVTPSVAPTSAAPTPPASVTPPATPATTTTPEVTR